jgi:hypothetical protein
MPVRQWANAGNHRRQWPAAAFARHAGLPRAQDDHRRGRRLRNASGGAGHPHSLEILSHINHLLVRSAEIIRGGASSSSQVASWDEECAGFLTALAELDRELASRVLSPAVEKKLLQGPLSDAMTHVGQLAMLRRWAGDPLPGERYTEAPIEAGRF